MTLVVHTFSGETPDVTHVMGGEHPGFNLNKDRRFRAPKIDPHWVPCVDMIASNTLYDFDRTSNYTLAW